MGAPKGNKNAIKTGRYSSAITIGKLPAKLSYVTKQLSCLRNSLRKALVESKGRVDFRDEAAIQTIVRCELHARVCQHELESNWDTLNSDQRRAISREIARVSKDRDRVARNLGITTQQRRTIGGNSMRPNGPSGPKSTDFAANVTDEPLVSQERFRI